MTTNGNNPATESNYIAHSITPAQIKALPLWSYEEPVFVVRSAKQIEAAVVQLLGHASPQLFGAEQPLLLGLDIEWKPMFSPTDPYNVTSLLQLYVHGSAVIFRLNDLHTEQGREKTFVFPPLLRELLENPYIYKAGLAVKEDAERLANDFGIQTHGCLDIKELPIYETCRPRSMVALSAIFLGVQISKDQATSNWENTRLTQRQIRYAATDAYLSRELYIAMQAANNVRSAAAWRE